MRLQTFLVTILLGASAVSAEMLIITDQPIPTPPPGISEEEVRLNHLKPPYAILFSLVRQPTNSNPLPRPQECPPSYSRANQHG